MDPDPKPMISGLTQAQRTALEQRFLNKVAADPATGCINWTGAKARDGYGQFGIGSKKVHRAHRVAYELKHGPIAPGQIVRHRCHNRQCVNPEHLETGTHQDNMDDMTEGRQGRSKLTNKEVTIIGGFAILGLTNAEIATECGVSVDTVRDILSGRRRPDAVDRELDRDLRGAVIV
jgi:hypothetical protein